MASSSLRRQLLVWLLVPLAGVVAANTWLTYRTARITAGTLTDRTLLASARSLAENIEVRDGHVDAMIAPAALGMFASEHRDHVYYRITAPDGRLVAGSPDLPEPGERIEGQRCPMGSRRARAATSGRRTPSSCAAPGWSSAARSPNITTSRFRVRSRPHRTWAPTARSPKPRSTSTIRTMLASSGSGRPTVDHELSLRVQIGF